MSINKEKNFISAVIYVYNQEETIYTFLNDVHRELKTHFEKFEIICVNDASSDRSYEEIKKFSAGTDSGIVSCINMSYYQGMELSMNAGVGLSIGDFVYEFDVSYMNYPVSLIMDIYYHSLKGYDIVSAVPKHVEYKISALFYKIYNKCRNTQYPLQSESFRILSRRAINRILAMSRTLPYRKAVYANCGLKMDYLEYSKTNIDLQISKNEKRMQLKIGIDALILYTDIAYKMAMFFSGVMFIITTLTAAYALTVFLTSQPLAGWTSSILFLSFGFFVICAILTVLVKYASLILKLILNKQKYVIESIEKLK